MLAAVLPVVVLAGGVTVAWMLVKTAPKSAPQPPPRLARLVETQPVEFKPQPTILHVHGTVQPAREVTVFPRVSGEVIEISPALIPGGRFEEGAMLAKIDPLDFELAVRQRETDLARAKAALALEMGQQSVAQREYALLGEGIPDENRDLVLRQPQLAQARATLDAAEAALDLARLNLERTSLRAPFNATLRTRHVNVGMQVTPNSALATLTGSDEYWVELTLPVDQLRWVSIPDASHSSGSVVRLTSVSSGNGHAVRTGEVLRLLPDLEPNGRLARVLVSVHDPRSLLPENAGKPPLILGDYVRAEIEGVGLASAAALDRRVFRDGDVVWVMNAQKQLEVRPVTVGFRTVNTMLVTAGLEAGEQIIVTDLPAAVPGMALRTPEDAARAGERRGPGTQPPGGGVTAVGNGESHRP
jgi:RND family efflux transporter MFP subunit